jgi:glycosyltransferase involved in cell wall biosynthesis
MRVGLLLPGFSSHENDWAIPVQLNLAREIARHEDVRVLALRYPHRRDHYRVFSAEVFAMGVGQVRGLRRLALWIDTLNMLRQLHKERRFDILHSMWADETGLIAVWAGKLLNIPVVVSIAGGELVGFDDIGYGLQRSVFSRWIVGQALSGADRLVVACSYIRRLTKMAGYHVPDDRVKTIVLGVDTDIFRPPVFQTTSSKRLIHVASLVGVKDQAMLLKAVARLGEDVTLDIAGTGPEEPGLRKLVSELDLSERVRFAGAVQHLDLPRYFQQSRLNVLTSRHEGLGMVTLEAAACGVPTVGTDVGLLLDYPQLGISVPVEDEAALANHIQSLLNDSNQWNALSQSALKLVREQFTIQHTVSQFRKLYAELISGHH